MLVYTPFALCFVTLRGIFMHFPELTYNQDATVPVPYFLLFLCFRKATQEILSEYWTKQKPNYFSRSIVKSKDETEGARCQPHPRVARPWPCHQVVRPPGPPPDTALPPIYSPQWEKPKGPITFPQNILFRGKEIRPLGFSHRGELIDKRASSEVGPAGLIIGRRGQGLGRAPWWWAWLIAPLCLIFVLREASVKIGGSAFISSNSENISCVTFLKHKNSRKQGTGNVASC
jgi:hypothetical protein